LPPTLVEGWKKVFFSIPETRRLVLGDPSIEFQDDCIIVTFRDFFTRNLFVDDHLSQIEAGISELREKRVRIVARSLDNVTQKSLVLDSESGTKKPVANKVSSIAEPIYHSRPRPNLTFVDFVVGVSNREAYEAAQAVAKWEDGFDTLFLTGPIGCGKTHLLWSAWRQVMKTREKVKTCYVLASDFAGHYVRITRPDVDRSEKLAFDNLYSTVDLFLMDDLHDLIGKVKTQQQLRIFIEKLLNKGAYVMLSSKCPLEDLRPGSEGDPESAQKKGLTDTELYSRLQGFLSAKIRPPDFELRVAILLSKARENPVPFELEVGLAQEIAQRINVPDVRPLEGIIKRLKIKVASGQKVDSDLIKELLGEIPQNKLHPEAIIKAVADHFGTSPEAIKSGSRIGSTVRARHIACYLCRKLLPQVSPMDLGRSFKKDRSTVIQGASGIEEKYTDAGLLADILAIEGKIKSSN